jgi:hypothetical protein
MNDLKEQIARPRKVALYASLTITEFYMLWEVHYTDVDERYDRLPDGQKREVPHDGYVRVSEPIDLNFKAVSSDEVVRNAVASLDEQERQAIADLNTKLAAIRGQKAQILALTHQPQMELA